MVRIVTSNSVPPNNFAQPGGHPWDNTTSVTYRFGKRILRRVTGGAISPYAAYAFALAFKNDEYWWDGARQGVGYSAEIAPGGGTFDSGAGWVIDGAGLTISGGKLNWAASISNLTTAVGTLKIGARYEVTYTIDSISAGGLRVVDTAAGFRTTAGTYTEVITSTRTSLLLGPGGQTTTAVIDNISIRSIDAGLMAVPGYTFTRSGAVRQENDGTVTYEGAELVTGATGGAVNVGASTVALQTTTPGLVVGQPYKVRFTVTNYVAGASYAVRLGNNGLNDGTVNYSGNGTYETTVTPGNIATGDLTFFVPGGGSSNLTLSAVSVKAVLSDAFDSFAANVPAVVPGIGYWSREALTNHLTYSQDFTQAAWVKDSVAVTANTQVAPDGTTTAETLTASAANLEHRVYNQAAPLGAVVITKSVFVKAGTASFVAIGDGNVTSGYVVFDLSTGVISSTAGTGGPVGYIVNYGSGWYRCVLVVTNASQYLVVNIGRTALEAVPQTAWSAAGTETIHIWQGQILTGNHPDGGPVIVTGAATASTGADTFKVNARADGAALVDEDQLFIVSLKLSSVAPTSYRNLMTLAPSTNDFTNYVEVYQGGGGGIQAYIAAAGLDALFVPTGLGTGLGKTTIILRRRAGKWTAFSRTQGVNYIGTEGAASGFPTGVNLFAPGNFTDGTGQAQAPVEFAGIRKGTFSNTEVTTLLETL